MVFLHNDNFSDMFRSKELQRLELKFTMVSDEKSKPILLMVIQNMDKH